VVVVVLEVIGAGATITGAGAGTVSTTAGAGAVVSSTVLWYEHPVTIPIAAMAAGMIAIRLIDLILVASIGYIPENSKKPAT
jgi:hypothetical protein